MLHIKKKKKKKLGLSAQMRSSILKPNHKPNTAIRVHNIESLIIR